MGSQVRDVFDEDKKFSQKPLLSHLDFDGLYSTNLFKRNDIIVYCNFLKTDRIFSWNTSKFSSCPVDAENGFKLDNLINMKEDMYILVSKKSLIFSQFLPFKLYFPQIWNMNFFEKLFYSTITYEKPS